MNTLYFCLAAAQLAGIMTARILILGVWGTKPLPIFIKAALEEEIEESSIPLRVDIVDFSRVGDQFKKEALQNIEVWNCPQNLNIPLKAWNRQYSDIQQVPISF